MKSAHMYMYIISTVYMYMYMYIGFSNTSSQHNNYTVHVEVMPYCIYTYLKVDSG